MTLLRHCKVIDVLSGNIRETDIMVEDERIGALRKSKSRNQSDPDLEGAYVLPGLINCHVHLSIVFPFYETNPNESPALTALRCYRRGIDALRAGVTTVRTVGEQHRADIHLRTMIEKHWVEGPRIFSAGQGLSVTGGHGSGFGAVAADGPEDFRKKARTEFFAGANHLKIFISGGIGQRHESFEECQMTTEEIEAVVSVARSKNSYVAAHSGGSENILKAVKGGVASFEHGYIIDRKTARVMKDQGCFLCPTLGVSRSPEWMRDHRFEEWTIEKAVGAGAEHMESVRNAIREGVTIVNGTDAPPGDHDRGVNLTVREAEHYVEAGLSPLGAIQSCSVNPARMMGVTGWLGQVSPGYGADLVAMRGNPLKDIRAMRKIFFVMKAGKVVRHDFT